MYPFNRFLGTSSSVTLSEVGQLRFDNSSVSIQNLNIDNVQAINNISGEGESSLSYIMAGDGKTEGRSLYDLNPAAPEQASMVNNYEEQNIDKYKFQFGIIDFEESADETKQGRFHSSNTILAPHFATISDRRMKDNIKQIEGAMDKIKKLSGYKYKLKATGENSAGLMADEVKEVLPEAVHQQTSNDVQSVNYNAVFPLIVEGLKELELQLKALNEHVSVRPPTTAPAGEIGVLVGFVFGARLLLTLVVFR